MASGQVRRVRQEEWHPWQAQSVFAFGVGLGNGNENFFGGGIRLRDKLIQAHKAAGYRQTGGVPDQSADRAIVGAGIHYHGQVQVDDGTAQNGGGHGGSIEIAFRRSGERINAVGQVIESKFPVGGGIGGSDYRVRAVF